MMCACSWTIRPRLWPRPARPTRGTGEVSDDVAGLQEIHQWPGLAAVSKITASRQIGDHTSVESRYYLLSQAFPPERFNAIVREHWGIENRLHWMLDVVFNEDQSGNRMDHCPETCL